MTDWAAATADGYERMTRHRAVGEMLAALSDAARPIQVGDTLPGFCGGAFGRDSYSDKVVEGVGADWVVAREDDGPAVFATPRDEWEWEQLRAERDGR